MLQKKGESEERGERTGIREKWKWRTGGREKELQLKLPTATLVGDEPGRPITTYL